MTNDCYWEKMMIAFWRRSMLIASASISWKQAYGCAFYCYLKGLWASVWLIMTLRPKHSESRNKLEEQNDMYCLWMYMRGDGESEKDGGHAIDQCYSTNSVCVSLLGFTLSICKIKYPHEQRKKREKSLVSHAALSFLLTQKKAKNHNTIQWEQ